MILSRRHFGLVLAGGAMALPLMGATCTSQQIQQYETDALNIAQSLLNTASVVTSLLSGGALNTWNGIIASLQSDLTALQTAASSAPSASVTAVVNGINTALTFIADLGIAIPSSVSAIVAAAGVLLPLIEAAYSIVVTTATASARRKFAGATATMSVTKARLIVAAYAAP